MSARDELAEILHREGAYCGLCGWEEGGCADCTKTLSGYADAILAAGYVKPRTISTIEELDALPFEAVIRDSEGFILERWGEPKENLWATVMNPAYIPRVDIDLPATVLYTPKES